jgi:hypothetical protein
MKKGQSALEFLATYGWAFLVIMIMIAALAYFGVLDPSRFLPKQCAFTAPFGSCQDSRIGDGILQLVVVNGANKDMIISAVSVNGTAGTGTVERSIPNANIAIDGVPYTGQTIRPGQLIAINTTNSNVSSGVQVKSVFAITYRAVGDSFDKTVTGQFNGRCCE